MRKLLGAAALDLELVSRDILRLAPRVVVVVADDFKVDDAASSSDDGKRTTTTTTTANASSSSKLEKLFLRAADGVQYALTRRHHQSTTITENDVGVVCSSSDGEVVYAWLTASRFVLMLAMTRETEEEEVEEEEEEEEEEEFVRVRKKFQAMESALTRARMNPFFEEEEEKDDSDDDDERGKEAGGKKWESFRQALANAAEV